MSHDKDAALWSSFFAGLVNHKEVRLEYEKLAEIVENSISTSTEMQPELNYKIKIHESAKVGRHIFELNIRKQIDILTAITVAPNSVFKLAIGGRIWLTINSGETGRIEFDSVIIITALSYNAIDLYVTSPTDTEYELTYEGITVKNNEDKKLLETITSKNIPWIFHKEMKDPIYYYRGMCIPVDGAQYCF